MDDPSKFLNMAEYTTAMCAVGLLILSECIIFLMTAKGRGKGGNRSDRGTVWLVFIGWCCSMTAGAFFRSQDVPEQIRGWLLPHFFYYIGIALIVVGIVVRCTAVLTLKQAFTLSVQITSDQHLITTGLYRIVRNPAYTGSILSLLGAALVYLHIFGLLSVLVISGICYGVRIHVEERALKAQFQTEFEQYCAKTKYRLIPLIY